MEIGGLNSIEPLTVSAELDLPVIDADGMGRAFPELQMFFPCIQGHEVTPTILTDEKVNFRDSFKESVYKLIEFRVSVWLC